VYVNQTNLNGKLRKKLGGQAKICGAMAHPGPPLELPSLLNVCAGGA